MSAQWKESLSLEESNKVRISLGLKPIADPNSSTAPKAELTSDEQGELNYAKKLEREREEKASEALKAKIDKMRNGRERNKRLTGVGLGADPNEGIKLEDGTKGEEDNRVWIKLQKKRAKELAKKREQDLIEADIRDQQQESYGEKDLVGLKVDHQADDFEEGEDVVLTLKDNRILDDEGESTICCSTEFVANACSSRR